MLKAGSSALSARTAAAHTGALVGDDRVVDAVFASLGVIRVDSIEDMLITAGAAAALGRLAAARHRHRVDLRRRLRHRGRPGRGPRRRPAGTRRPAPSEALAEVMPDYGTVQNPLDVTGAAIIDPSLFTRSIEAISADPSIGVVGVINSLPWAGEGPYFGQKFVDAIGAGMRAAACPAVYISQVMLPITDYSRESMALGGVPLRHPRTAAGHRRAARRRLVVRGHPRPARCRHRAAAPQAAPGRGPPRASRPPAPPPGQWSEQAARALLAGAGIPVVPARLVTSEAAAVAAAGAIADAARQPPP